MKNEAFDELLRAWGYAYGPRRAAIEEGAGMYGTNALANLGRPPTIRQRVNMDRGGIDRRLTMGEAAGLVDAKGRTRLLPTWAAAPVKGTETRSSHARILDASAGVPPEAEKVERAVLHLHRVDADLATVIRTQYCTLGRQTEKSQRIGLSMGVYRERLAEARGWVRREISA